MTERLERIGKIILISPTFETSVKSTRCSVADEETPVENEDVDKILNIPHELYDRLFSHQKYGVRWLYGLYSEHLGGILGIDLTSFPLPTYKFFLKHSS
jgi:SNF2 family DNA or RNA helicase